MEIYELTPDTQDLLQQIREEMPGYDVSLFSASSAWLGICRCPKSEHAIASGLSPFPKVVLMSLLHNVRVEKHVRQRLPGG